MANRLACALSASPAAAACVDGRPPWCSSCSSSGWSLGSWLPQPNGVLCAFRLRVPFGRLCPILLAVWLLSGVFEAPLPSGGEAPLARPLHLPCLRHAVAAAGANASPRAAKKMKKDKQVETSAPDLETDANPQAKDPAILKAQASLVKNSPALRRQAIMQKSLTELTLSTFGVGLISSALMLRGMWRASGSPGVDGDGTPLPPVDDSTLGLPATAWLGVVSGSLVVGLSSMLAKRQLARRAHRRERDVSVQAAFDGTAQYYAGAPPPGTTGSLATGRENLQEMQRKLKKDALILEDSALKTRTEILELLTFSPHLFKNADGVIPSPENVPSSRRQITCPLLKSKFQLSNANPYFAKLMKKEMKIVENRNKVSKHHTQMLHLRRTLC
eukprot:GHVT01087291.1.p1 GENE.GHVT01087291.1~~GHVT01087291.1.p1  ORF type:complete len:387 (-),score=89.31 GHVT01087291.1:104-1264(-)